MTASTKARRTRSADAGQVSKSVTEVRYGKKYKWTRTHKIQSPLKMNPGESVAGRPAVSLQYCWTKLLINLSLNPSSPDPSPTHFVKQILYREYTFPSQWEILWSLLFSTSTPLQSATDCGGLETDCLGAGEIWGRWHAEPNVPPPATVAPPNHQRVYGLDKRQNTLVVLSSAAAIERYFIGQTRPAAEATALGLDFVLGDTQIACSGFSMATPKLESSKRQGRQQQIAEAAALILWLCVASSVG